jgi:hypothetical protein
MEEDKKTPCECPLAGYCNRHGVTKHLHHHKLCQNHQGYFDMWEEGRGPGQKRKAKKPEQQKDSQPKCKFCKNTGCTGECRNNNQLPSTTQMAKNLAKATKDHVKSGLKTVGEDEIKQRLEICGDCEHYIPHSARCKLCGCFTKFKAKLKSGGCPINKW